MGAARGPGPDSLGWSGPREMAGVDISQFSEEEQKILRGVFERAKDEEERDRSKFRQELERVQILEAAIEQRRQKLVDVDLKTTCNVCFKVKFADGIGHGCNQCQKRCCARCGVKVVQQINKNKSWLCVVCRLKNEITLKYGSWQKGAVIQQQQQQREAAKAWRRTGSLEEEAHTEKQTTPLPFFRRQFPSALNIAAGPAAFWNAQKIQPPATSPFRPEPAHPPREDPPVLHHPDKSQSSESLQRRYTRRRSSLDTIRNDSLSSDQSENPPAAPRPKPRQRGNGAQIRYRRSGSSESEDEARSSPSSCRDSESDRVSMRKEKSSIVPRATRWRSQEDFQHATSHNVYWKRSRDGNRYLGHMVIRKEILPDGRGRQGLGMRVVGGHVVDEDSGIVGAIVENIREGSLADKIGRIEPGDEVLEWNGQSFRGLHRDDVASIIALSKSDPQVQLLVSRLYGRNVPNPVDPIEMRRVPPPHLEVHPEAMQRCMLQESRFLRYPDRNPTYLPTRTQMSAIGGKVLVRLHYNPRDLELNVVVDCAKDLPPRDEINQPNPYVKVVLLPYISAMDKRRTKTFAHTSDPQWKQSFNFTHIRQSELRNKSLQISVWDYEREAALNYFIGEVVIPLRTSNLNSVAQWYSLSMHQEVKPPPTTSPPVSASHLSDEEELSDYDEKFLEHTERRIMAVDSSPPFREEERRRQKSLPFNPLGERSRSLTAPSPTAEFPRGRIREPGFGDRRRSRSMAGDYPDSRNDTTPGYGSRSVSPPQYRPQFQPTPRPSTSQRLHPPQNSFRKRQLPQVPLSRSASRTDLEERFRTLGAYGGGSLEYDRFSTPRRGGGSRMAAALGVGGPTSPLVSPDRSDSESSSKFSLSSAFHRNSRTFEEFRGRSSAYGGPVHPSSRADMDGSLSDTAVGLVTESKSLVRRSTPTDTRSPYLSKKSSSTSQLSVTGHKKRLIFRRRNGSSSSFVVQRSEEILPDLRAGSSVSSDGSISGDSLTWGARLPPEVGEATGFVEGLGPGQLVGRQALASPSLGEVQLGICERKNCLEVEVIRAKGLLPKANAKVLPAPYVKVYLLDGRKCISKQKTGTARRTLDPLYQQQLVFHEDFRNCFLQVTVWGNYNSMERKVFMGVAQIVLDDIDLVKGVINWYKLFHHSSLVSSLAANDRSSFLSLDSFG